MPECHDQGPLLWVLTDLVAWFKAEQVPGAVIGGVAASILGRPRLTQDVDALVVLEESRWPGFLAAGTILGFVPRRADALALAQETRVLLTRHQPSGMDADIVFAGLRFEEEAVARATWLDLGGVQIPLPRPEDLIILKAVAHRPRDLGDIEAILAAHPQLNRRRVRRWVREFAVALGMPDLLGDLEALLAKSRRGKKARH
jgi:hypothetical protein